MSSYNQESIIGKIGRYNDPFDQLWDMLEIADEGVIEVMSSSLRKQGCYGLDDLAFLSLSNVSFPGSVKPITIRKLKTICEFYSKGYQLDPDMMMPDVLRILNGGGKAAIAPAPTPTPMTTKKTTSPRNQEHNLQRPIQREEEKQQHLAKEEAKRQGEEERRRKMSKKKSKLIHVVIAADFSNKNAPGQVHLREFQQCYRQGVRVFAIVSSTSNQLPDALVRDCRVYGIKIHSTVADVNPPFPSLWVLGATRIHDAFQIVDRIAPPTPKATPFPRDLEQEEQEQCMNCILMDVPHILPSKSLEAICNCGQDRNVPIILHASRAIANYVTSTLDMAASTMEPRVMWHVRGRYASYFTELIVAVMYFGVKADSIVRFQVNPALTTLQPSTAQSFPSAHVFERCAFQMTTQSGVQFSIVNDGTTHAEAFLGAVQDSSGQTVAQYDHLQTDCSMRLKERVVRMMLLTQQQDNGGSSSKVVLPTIRMGVQALKLAEYIQVHLSKAVDATPSSNDKKNKNNNQKSQKSPSLFKRLSSLKFSQ